MPFNLKQLLKDSYGRYVPQFFNQTTDTYEVATGSDGAAHVKLMGSNVVEQKTQANATNGNVTFSKAISTLEIYNTDATNQGVFNVNGINVTVPAKESFKASFAGTVSPAVSVTGSTSYILTRYE